jgi:hypothetical protein
MAAFISDTVLDQALSYIDSNCENLYLCSTEPTTFLQASDTYKLGVKATPSIGSPTNGDSSGRKIVVAAITDGTVSGTGTAVFIALTDDSASLLLCVQALSGTQAVSTGNVFTLTEFDITIPDPA